MKKACVEEVIARNPNARSSYRKRRSYWRTDAKVEGLGAEIIDCYWYPELTGDAGAIAAVEWDI